MSTSFLRFEYCDCKFDISFANFKIFVIWYLEIFLITSEKRFRRINEFDFPFKIIVKLISEQIYSFILGFIIYKKDSTTLFDRSI